MKTSIEKRRKICTFCEGLVHGFGQKTEIFPSFVFMQNRPRKEKKQVVLVYENLD